MERRRRSRGWLSWRRVIEWICFLACTLWNGSAGQLREMKRTIRVQGGDGEKSRAVWIIVSLAAANQHLQKQSLLPTTRTISLSLPHSSNPSHSIVIPQQLAQQLAQHVHLWTILPCDHVRMPPHLTRSLPSSKKKPSLTKRPPTSQGR